MSTRPPISPRLVLSVALALGLIGWSSATTADDRPCVVVVVGTPGTPEYAASFRDQAERWSKAAVKAPAEFVSIGTDPNTGAGDDRERLRAALAARAGGQAPLWLVLIGHGTFDGHEARFNLRGPDVTDAQLAGWLAQVKRPVAVIDCSSGSAPFLRGLSAPGRTVVTATRSGDELNYARFGEFISATITDPVADLDKDGQVSLLEAFLAASARVAEFYRTRARLATEHALIDDNGDRLGTPPDWFEGVRAVRRAKDGAALDGPRAHQLCLVPGDRERSLPADVRRRRDELELAAAALRDRKARLSETEYYQRLEALMLDLARLYRDHPSR